MFMWLVAVNDVNDYLKRLEYQDDYEELCDLISLAKHIINI